ncbi:MAG TPA: 5'/3'-nucleotidase SurE [bacterium]|nr:5'/3'-nucleotidase SurE [bacterium]
MKILLTNDDGFDAPGLAALAAAFGDFKDVAVAAPDQQASASGHSISLHRPMEARRDPRFNRPDAFRVSSTPADCVRLAILQLLPWKPDLVISGVNQGANYGSLIFYSGTVAAAAEAVLLGVPAMAVSLTSHTSKDFGAAAAYAKTLARHIGERGLESGTLLNVNVPPLAKDRIKGAVLTHQGQFRHVDDLAPHPHLAGHYHYVLDSPTEPMSEDPDSDVARVGAGFISVTPLHLDLTAKHQFPGFVDWPWGDRSWMD